MKTIDSFGIADAGALPVPAISKHLWATMVHLTLGVDVWTGYREILFNV